jgi:glutathione peroxidase
MTTVYDFKVNDISGNNVDLSAYEGKVLLIVNTASKCGFTVQYKGLEAIYKDYSARGFEVLGFPCNQFGKQEPGDSGQIAEFCELNFGVTFPLFEKVDVNGSDAAPVFDYLKVEAPGLLGTEGIKWNFTKFLIGRDGAVIKRFGSKDKPESLRRDIEKALR